MIAAMLFSLISCGGNSDNGYPGGGYAKSSSADYDMYYDYYDEPMYDYYAEPMAEAEAYYGDYEYYEESGSTYSSLSSSTGTAPDSSAKNDLSNRKIIKTANMSFETQEYDTFMDSLTTCVKEYGGFIESSEQNGGGINYNKLRWASITARIPASAYDRFMEEAGNIGYVTYKSESSEDVTMSYSDTESRINALKTEYDALVEILDKADNLDDILDLQARLTDVIYDLESYESRLKKYDDLISYCTVYINVSEVETKSVDYTVEKTFGQKISEGLGETFEDIGEGFSDFAIWFVTSLPYIIIWAVIIFVIVIIIRACVRRSKKKKQEKMMKQYLEAQNTENK